MSLLFKVCVAHDVMKHIYTQTECVNMSSRLPCNYRAFAWELQENLNWKDRKSSQRETITVLTVCARVCVCCCGYTTCPNACVYYEVCMRGYSAALCVYKHCVCMVIACVQLYTQKACIKRDARTGWNDDYRGVSGGGCILYYLSYKHNEERPFNPMNFR